MIDNRKRAVIVVADRLGWLNWADRAVIDSVVRRANLSRMSQTASPRARSSRGFRAESHKGERVPDDSSEGLLNLESKIRQQLSKEELSAIQPGPVFAEQPEAFVSWVSASLISVERHRKGGIDRALAAQLGREARTWIAHGFVGRQTTRSRRFLPALVRLWNVAIALEDESLDESERTASFN